MGICDSCNSENKKNNYHKQKTLDSLNSFRLNYSINSNNSNNRNNLNNPINLFNDYQKDEDACSSADNFQFLETEIGKLIDLLNEYASEAISYENNWNNDELSEEKDITLDFALGKVVGLIKDSKLNGKGTNYSEGKKLYEGELKENKLDGRGTLYLYDSKGIIILEGEINGNLFNGKGTVNLDNGGKMEMEIMIIYQEKELFIALMEKDLKDILKMEKLMGKEFYM